MLKNPEAHQLRQRQLQIQDLTKTPETQRAARFLLEHLGKAERVAKQACKIRTSDEDMKKIFEKARGRLDKMQDVLGNLHDTPGDVEHPPIAERRTAFLNRNTEQSVET